MNTNRLYFKLQTLNCLHVRNLEGTGGTLAMAATREERSTNEEKEEEEEEEEEEATGAVKWHYIDCGERAKNLF
jgi:hypothetical protein